MKGSSKHFKELAYFGQTIRRALEMRVIMDHSLQLQGKCSLLHNQEKINCIAWMLAENLTTCEHMGEYLSIHEQYCYRHCINTNQD